MQTTKYRFGIVYLTQVEIAGCVRFPVRLSGVAVWQRNRVDWDMCETLL